MQSRISLTAFDYKFNLRTYFDLSIAVNPYLSPLEQVQTFGLPPSSAQPFRAGSFIASVDAGGSVNCPIVSSLCAHSNGTHTECVGHALPGKVTLSKIEPIKPLLTALLLSVTPRPIESAGAGGSDLRSEYPPGKTGDLVVSGDSLEESFKGLSLGADFLSNGALVVRTLPNIDAKRTAQYGGTNPPYFTRCAMQWVLEKSVQHLLMDLPSADREDDSGMLIAHRTFWNLQERALPPELIRQDKSEEKYSSKTITELVYADSSVKDGQYILNLQVSPIDMDAAPSRPLLFSIEI